MSKPSSIAALSLNGTPKRAFRILPAGHFTPSDGRPLEAPWYLTETRARQLVSLATQRAQDYIIDYEHQSLTPGQLAPAAGWFKQLEWRQDGLYVVDARWSDRAKAMIESGEYRFISPVFNYLPDGEVTALHSLGLTNNPALHGLTDLALIAVNSTRPGAVTPIDDMGAEDRAKFTHVFGAAPEVLQEQDRLRNTASPPPTGTSDEDWAKLRHVFGSALDGLK